MRASYSQTVCSVTVIDPNDMQEGSESGHNIDSGFGIDSTNNAIEGGPIVAAHTAGGHEAEALGIPKQLHKQWPVRTRSFRNRLS